jgi:hypothetical protein
MMKVVVKDVRSARKGVDIDDERNLDRCSTFDDGESRALAPPT